MRPVNALCGILTVLAACLASGCGLMQARNDNALEPRGATAFERAVDYEEQQEFVLAVKEYHEALRENPGDSRCWVNLGLIQKREGNTRYAVACWRNAIRVNPDDARAYNLLGNVWKDDGEYSRAIAHYRRAIEADPKYADPYWNMAAACRQLNMESDAAEHYSGFVALATASEHEDVAKAKVFLAELSERGIADRPGVIVAPAVARTAPAAGDETSEVVSRDGDAAVTFVGGTSKLGETEAKPDVTGQAGAPEKTSTGDEKAPVAEVEKSTEAGETPTDEAVDGKKAKMAAELEGAVRETGMQATADQ